ncbi:TPA: DUF551 domain-containing protein [Klebsiella variicola subsp. variicola]|nr:DUF551 domain-containing protein [Klebsiella variicola subsp. variicola]
MKDHEIRELVNQLRDIAIEYHGTQQLRARIARAVRAAMLAAAPQPQNAPQNIPEIIPDGWIPVSEHLPKEKGVYQVWNGKYVDNVPFWFGSFQSLHSELITHWMPLPAAPQEVKGE